MTIQAPRPQGRRPSRTKALLGPPRHCMIPTSPQAKDQPRRLFHKDGGQPWP